MQEDATEERSTSGEEAGRTRAGKIRLRTLSDIDARTAAYRRFAELVTSYSSDLGDDLSTAESAIVQRIVSLQVWLENAEVVYAETGELDIATYTTASNAMRRLLTDIGLQRRARDVTPDLHRYVNQGSKNG